MRTHLYYVLESESTRELEELVRSAIADGYMPTGGISVAVWSCQDRDGYWENHTGYFQAIVPQGKRND